MKGFGTTCRSDQPKPFTLADTIRPLA